MGKNERILAQTLAGSAVRHDQKSGIQNGGSLSLIFTFSYFSFFPFLVFSLSHSRSLFLIQTEFFHLLELLPFFPSFLPFFPFDMLLAFFQVHIFGLLKHFCA